LRKITLCTYDDTVEKNKENHVIMMINVNVQCGSSGVEKLSHAEKFHYRQTYCNSRHLWGKDVSLTNRNDFKFNSQLKLFWVTIMQESLHAASCFLPTLCFPYFCGLRQPREDGGCL